jgi:hypothetical protein
MNFNYFIILLRILIAGASIQIPSRIKPKFCVDCKFFKNSIIGNRHGTCSQFSYIEITNYNLIDGKIDIPAKHYYFCSTARQYEHLCGEEGKLYEKKEIPMKWNITQIFQNYVEK